VARRKRAGSVHGVLVVDKPKGPTSHDVVQWIRRALRTRAVGHAGTLDPMATGVLVAAIGEGTKLVRWLTADDKRYRATVALGAQTDTLDADGEIVERVAAEGIDLPSARAAAERFVGTYVQRPPIYSAIKVDGERLHARARRGEQVEVPEREVTVRSLEILSASDAEIELEVESAKGFYVRSLARDLARALDTRGHLTALRRTKSGAFGLEDAVSADLLRRAADDDEARVELTAQLLSLPRACARMESVVLGADAVADARHGRRVLAPSIPGAGVEPIALFDEAGGLIAIARSEGEHLRVIRGISPDAVSSPS